MSALDDFLGSKSTPQSNQPPTPKGGALDAFLSAKPSTQPVTPPATPSPYFYAKNQNGSTIGASEEKDISGKPFLAYRKPGDTATSTDKTRVATTFDPRTPQKLDPSVVQNGRIKESASQAIRAQLGASYSDELDHKIALELAGSNDRSNLGLEPDVPGTRNTATDPLENSLAKDVVSGKTSLLDAQMQLAKAKNFTIPDVNPQPSFIDKFIGGVKKAGESIKNLFVPPKADAETPTDAGVTPTPPPASQNQTALDKFLAGNPGINAKTPIPGIGKPFTPDQQEQFGTITVPDNLKPGDTFKAPNGRTYQVSTPTDQHIADALKQSGTNLLNQPPGKTGESTPQHIDGESLGTFYKKVGDYLFNPKGEVQPSNLFTTEAEKKSIGPLKGPRIVTGTASIINNFMNGLVNGAAQGVVDIYAAGQQLSGKSGEVKLPFNPERIGFTPEDITNGGAVKPLATAALDRIKQLDQQRPNTPNLNLAQGFAEKVLSRAVINPLIVGDLGKNVTQTLLEWTKSSPQLGLSATEIKNLSPQDAVNEVGQRFFIRANQIIKANSTDGVLNSYGRGQIQSLISETKNLGQAFANEEIPQLNVVGRFLDDMAIKLNQDVVNIANPTSLGVSKILPGDETLPGYRARPGQAAPAGLSTEEREPVGFGDKKPTITVGGRTMTADDIHNSSDMRTFMKTLSPEDQAKLTEFDRMNSRGADIGNGAQKTMPITEIKHPVPEGGETAGKQLDTFVQQAIKDGVIPASSDSEASQSLVNYIKENGVDSVPPIEVLSDGTIIDGNHRYDAFKALGIKDIPVVVKGETPPVFKGYEDLSTNILNKLEGKSTVSKQFISDLTNSADLKQTERDIIRQILTEYPGATAIPVQQFADKVKAELLPLKVNSSDTYKPTNSKIHVPDAITQEGNFTPKYENIALPPESRGNVANYKENIYESPVATSAGETHFAYTSKNYFGHTRVEDLTDNSTRRIIEVQSDLYQKGNLENEKIGLTTFKSTAQGTKPYSAAERIARETEVSKLSQYNDPTAHFRMVREEVKQAAIDGKTKLQFPTGETAMKIEQLSLADAFRGMDESGAMHNPINQQDLRVGRLVGDVSGKPWIITDVLGDGKFKAVPKRVWEGSYINKDETDLVDHRASIEANKETFDISGKVDTKNPIYRFYEKTLGRYLASKYGAKIITDKQGVSWYELNVPKEAAKKPVTAFKYKTLSSGPKAPIADIKKLIEAKLPGADIKIIFDKNLLKDSGKWGEYKSYEDLFSGQMKTIIRLYEKGGKVPARVAMHEVFHALKDAMPAALQKSLNTETLKAMSAADHKYYYNLGYRTSAEQAEEFQADEWGKEQADKAGYKSRIQKVLDKINEFIQKVIKLAQDIYKRIQETPNKQGGFAKVPFADGNENELTSAEKRVIEAFNNSKDQEIIGSLNGEDLEIGSYGKNAIERKTNNGQEDRLPISEIKPTTKYIQDQYKAGVSGFRKDNIVSVAKMPDGEYRAIVTRVNQQGKNEVINFFKIGRNATKFIENLKSFGTPGENRTRKAFIRKEGLAPSNEDINTLQKTSESVKSFSVIEQKLTELNAERSSLEEAVNNNPAKNLTQYVNKQGELPQALGTSRSKFGRVGDQLANDLGFRDSETARLAYLNYKVQVKRLNNLKESIKTIKELQKQNKLEDKDAKSLGSFLEKGSKLTDQKIKELVAKKKSADIQRKIDARKKVQDGHLSRVLQALKISTPEIQVQSPKTQLDLLQNSVPLSLADHEKINADVPWNKIIIDTNTPVKYKVGLLDYLRTPDRVLQKIGLGKTAEDLRTAYESYLQELPLHIEVITDWSNRVGKDGNERIFKYLDGQNMRKFYSGDTWIPLTPEEMKVAHEIKIYLQEWAERLGLPEDNQISHYITHIFSIGENEKEFDEEVAKLIKDQVPGSVYDPFLEKRLGKKGYIEDTWKALDAYVKRAVRKANMDPVLERLKVAANRLEESQMTYVKSLAQRVNLRPTTLDTLADNTIKQLVGYRFGQRPVALLTRGARQMIYRAMLGLNVSSAIKNLTQGTNTFAKLGVRYTSVGYIKLFTKGLGNKELEEQGILKQDLIQDRVLSSTRKMLQKFDEGLFLMFETVEKINRGAAYWGAKAKAINAGHTEADAIKYAKKIVRDTQFLFGAIDTPVGLNSDIAKVFTQFMSYGVKQTEFAAEMLKNKEWGGIMRYIVVSLFLVYALGKIFNFKATDFVPGYSVISKFGVPPAFAVPWEIIKAVMDAPGYFGNKRNTTQKIIDVAKTLPIPATVQAQKTYGGLKAYTDQSKDIKQSPGTLLKAATLGSQNLPPAHPELQQAKADQTAANKQQKSRVQTEYDRIKASADPAAEWDKLNASNPALAKAVATLAKKPTLNIVEKGFMFLGVENGRRAQAIVTAIQKLPKDQQAAYYQELLDKKVITKAVAEQIAFLLQK